MTLNQRQMNFLKTCRELHRGFSRGLEPSAKEPLHSPVFYTQVPSVPLENYEEAFRGFDGKKALFEGSFTVSVPRTSFFIPETLRGRKHPIITKIEGVLKCIPKEQDLLPVLKDQGLVNDSVDNLSYDVLRGVARKLQSEHDAGKDVSELLRSTTLLLALKSDQQVAVRVHSPTRFNCLTGLDQLFDRVRDEKKVFLSHEERLSPLVERHARILDENGFRETADKVRALGTNFSALSDFYSSNQFLDKQAFDAAMVERNKALAEITRGLREAKGDKARVNVLRTKEKTIKREFEERIGLLKAFYRDLTSPDQVIDSHATSVSQIINNARKKSGEEAHLEFDSTPSVRDRYAGWLAEDCLKNNHTLFNNRRAHCIKVFETNGGERIFRGMVYVTEGTAAEKPVLNIDAFQVHALVDPVVLVRRFSEELLRKLPNAHGITAAVESSLNSNHVTVRHGFSPYDTPVAVKFHSSLSRFQTYNPKDGHKWILKREEMAADA